MPGLRNPDAAFHIAARLAATAGDFNIRPTHLHESLRRAMVELLVNALRKEEFCRQLEDMLLDEFADERRQAVADRSLDPDA